jgi:hypothetical protein
MIAASSCAFGADTSRIWRGDRKASKIAALIEVSLLGKSRKLGKDNHLLAERR